MDKKFKITQDGKMLLTGLGFLAFALVATIMVNKGMLAVTQPWIYFSTWASFILGWYLTVIYIIRKFVA